MSGSGGLWRLVVSISAARNLPATQPPAYKVTAVLGSARRSTSVRGVRRDSRAEWAEDLLFEMDDDEYRKHVGGGTTVKLVLERSDGVKLGFVVLSLRQAKLNAERRETPRRRIDAAFSSSASASAGSASWTPLAGSARGKDHVELLIAYTLTTEAMGSGGGATRVQTISRTSRMRKAAARMRARGERTTARDAASPLTPAQLTGDAGPTATGGSATDIEDVEPLRRFRLGISYVSVKLSATLPLETVCAAVTASLPRQLEALVVRATPRVDRASAALDDDAGIDADSGGALTDASARHQVRSRPAVDAFRGVEAILPRGELEVELEAGAVHLAALLAAGCRIVAKLWHEDVRATPSKVLLGVCSIPLSQLLGGEMIEGYAPVIALEKGKQVEVARLRASLTLEELGIVETKATRRRHKGAKQVHENEDAARDTRQRMSADVGLGAHKKGLAAAGEDTESEHHHGHEKGGGIAESEAPRPATAVPDLAVSNEERGPSSQTVAPPRGGGSAGASAGGASGHHDHSLEASIREGREYAVAWELELWRQAEEAKFHAGLKNLESARLSSLETEFRRKDAARARDARAARAETEALRKKLAERLAEVESRETSLVQAEEKLSARSASLERMRTQGVHDAISSARRVQDEAEHTVRVETARATAAMHRAQAAEARSAELEHALDEARSKLASLVPDVAEVARLRAELALRDRAVAAAGRRVADALQAAKMWKSRYAALAERRRQEEYLSRSMGAAATLVQQRQYQQDTPMDGVAETGAKQQKRRQQSVPEEDEKAEASSDREAQDARAAKATTAVEDALEARRLIQERSALLLSGAYRERDILIQKLDRKIAQLVPV